MSTHWKDVCNYWHGTDKDGNRTNIIKVDGVEVAVSDELYAEYARMGRKERYAYEKEKGKLLSLEQMQEDSLLLGYLAWNAHVESAEAVYMCMVNERDRRRCLQRLPAARASLPQSEQALLCLLFDERQSIRQVARFLRIDESTVRYRLNRIFEKLDELIKKS